MFKKKGFIMAFILIISMIGMTACMKNVGSPEDNAQAEAVSYTHLDVYKRQHIRYPIAVI